MNNIFISDKREDQDKARQFANALEKNGFYHWQDPKLKKGEHLDDVIETALQEKHCVLAMGSGPSVQSSDVYPKRIILYSKT